MKSFIMLGLALSLLASNAFAANSVALVAKKSDSSFQISNNDGKVVIKQCKGKSEQKVCEVFATATRSELKAIEKDIKFEQKVQYGVDAIVVAGALFFTFSGKRYDSGTFGGLETMIRGLIATVATTGVIGTNHLVFHGDRGEQIEVIEATTEGEGQDTVYFENYKQLKRAMNKLSARLENVREN